MIRGRAGHIKNGGRPLTLQFSKGVDVMNQTDEKLKEQMAMEIMRGTKTGRQATVRQNY